MNSTGPDEQTLASPIGRRASVLSKWLWLPRFGHGLVERIQGFNPFMLLLIPAFYLATIHASDGRYPISSSYAPNVIWAYEWAEQFRLHIWYPRWMEHTYMGLGSPTFNFYGPFAMYASLPFSVGLGLPVSATVLYTSWSALLVLGIGMAQLTQCVLAARNRWLPTVIGVTAMLSPYAMINVYARGALAETWAMALYPWLLVALFRSLDGATLTLRYQLILMTAAFALCHPPSLLLGTSGIGFALFVISRNLADVVRAARRVVAPMAIGFALVGCYLVPAIGDQKYVNIKYLTNGGGPRAVDRLLTTELGRLSLMFVDGFEGLLVPAFAFYCVSILLVAYLLRRYQSLATGSGERKLVFLLACGALAAIMMTDLSRGVYALVPILNRIQFAWRWMVVLTVSALPIWGYVFLTATSRRNSSTLLLRIPVWLVTIWAMTYAFSTPMAVVEWHNADANRTDALFARMARAGRESDGSAGPVAAFRGLLRINTNNELVLEDVPEYQPFAKSDGQLPPRTYGYVEWVNGGGNVSNISWRPSHRSFTVDSPTGGRAIVRTSAWVGWQVTVNQESSVGDDDGDWGRMVIQIPAGHSNVKIDYIGTKNQRIGEAISLTVLLALLTFASYRAWKGRLTVVRL